MVTHDVTTMTLREIFHRTDTTHKCPRELISEPFPFAFLRGDCERRYNVVGSVHWLRKFVPETCSRSIRALFAYS
jgi:hypothetical protein